MDAFCDSYRELLEWIAGKARSVPRHRSGRAARRDRDRTRPRRGGADLPVVGLTVGRLPSARRLKPPGRPPITRAE